MHDCDDLNPDAYAYLLALYLGDGCIGAAGRTAQLRISLDLAYDGIIEAAAGAIEELRG